MSNIDQQITDLMASGNLPSKISLPEQEGDGSNPNVLDMGRLPLIIDLARLGQAVRTRKILEETARRRHFDGELDPRLLVANNNRQHILASPPWVNVFIANDGPNTVNVAFNTPHRWVQMLNGETRTINLADAARRIDYLYYWCPTAGWTANLRVEGYF